MFNITPLVRSLIIVNVVIFLLQNFASQFHLTEYMSLWPLGTPYFEPYQFFSYMFVHGSFGYIFSTC